MKKQNSDLIKFAKEFAYAYSPHTNRIDKLTLFDYQKKMLESLEKNKFTIIKHSRQVGVDTAVAIDIAHFVVKNGNKRALVISTNADCAIHFLEKIKTILYHANETPVINNKKSVELKNNSKITVTGYDPCSTKGFNCDLIYINNFEWLNDPQQVFLTSTMLLKSSVGRLIISSTPQYKEDFFYRLWTNSAKKINDFKQINVTWKQCPYFDAAWYEKMCKMYNHDPDKIATEIEGKFIDKKEKKKKVAINIRLDKQKKEKILIKMKQKNISSITDYIMELIDRDLG